MGCPEMSVTNYQSMLHKIPQKQKSRKFISNFGKACHINNEMKASFKTCVNNIKINIKEVIYMYAGYIHLTEDTVQWWILLNKTKKYCNVFSFG